MVDISTKGPVVKSVNTADLKSAVCKDLRIQVPPGPPIDLEAWYLAKAWATELPKLEAPVNFERLYSRWVERKISNPESFYWHLTQIKSRNSTSGRRKARAKPIE